MQSQRAIDRLTLLGFLLACGCGRPPSDSHALSPRSRFCRCARRRRQWFRGHDPRQRRAALRLPRLCRWIRALPAHPSEPIHGHPQAPAGTAFDFDLDGDSDLGLSPGALLEADLPSDDSVVAELPGTSTLWSNALATDLNRDGAPDLLAGNAFEVAAMLAPTFEPAFVPLSNDPALVLPDIAEFHRGAHLPEPLTATVEAFGVMLE